MSWLSKLLGGVGGSQPDADPTEYKGFTIVPTPASDGGKYRIGARIEKEIGDETKVHNLIRADTLETRDAADEASVAKAQLMIDQMGERLFDDP